MNTEERKAWAVLYEVDPSGTDDEVSARIIAKHKAVDAKVDKDIEEARLQSYLNHIKGEDAARGLRL